MPLSIVLLITEKLKKYIYWFLNRYNLHIFHFFGILTVFQIIYYPYKGQISSFQQAYNKIRKHSSSFVYLRSLNARPSILLSVRWQHRRLHCLNKRAFGDYKKATCLTRKISDFKKATCLTRKLSDCKKATCLTRKLSDFKKATCLTRKLSDCKKATCLTRKLSDCKKATCLTRKLSDYKNATCLTRKLSDYKKATCFTRKLGDYKKATCLTTKIERLQRGNMFD